jgi:hypothetical protein
MNSIDQATGELAGFIFGNIVNPLVRIGFLIAVLYFLYGVMKYILRANGDEKARAEGTKHMLWGSIGLTIMFTALALTYFAANTGNKLFLKSGGNDATTGLDNVGKLQIR